MKKHVTYSSLKWLNLESSEKSDLLKAQSDLKHPQTETEINKFHGLTPTNGRTEAPKSCPTSSKKEPDHQVLVGAHICVSNVDCF